ncbi:quinone oxidoreductase putative [Auriscalpium vulgare]|uniref:Quinone oxidoreductase putative n=1 Tax=Auriscalpium vulgare TaxID=40419 RepID=A0ACB8RWM4_9AGAM|nr:quinone oxidoreductase putative [Auriscalpium vulgare]
MATMRAVLIKDGKGPAENLFIGDAPKPVPQDDQVVVKIKFFGLNRMDVSQREGNYPPPPGVTSVMGVEFSGTIDGLGPKAAKWKVGDEVFGLAAGGAYAEYIAVPEVNIFKKPTSMSWTQAAAIPENFLTAYQALVECGSVKEGDDVLIHAGASGVGLAAVQLARYFGANTVTATASTKEKLDWLLSLPAGATHVANYKTENFVDIVKTATAGKGVDVIVDMVGQSHWQKNVDSIASDGRWAIVAFMSGAAVPSFSLLPILFKRIHIQGTTLRSRSSAYKAQLVSTFAELVPHFTDADGAGPLRTYIHQIYPWQEIQTAHREMEGNSNAGKIIVEIV